MSVSLTSIAHALRVQSQANATPIILGHAQQLIAAALGYNTLAAYQASLEESALECARHFVLDLDLVHQRAHELGVIVSAEQLGALLRSTFAGQLPQARFHRSESALEDYIRDRLDHLVTNDAEAASQMAMTNGDGIGEMYLPFDLSLANVPPPGELSRLKCWDISAWTRTWSVRTADTSSTSKRRSASSAPAASRLPNPISRSSRRS